MASHVFLLYIIITIITVRTIIIIIIMKVIVTFEMHTHKLPSDISNFTFIIVNMLVVLIAD